MGSVIFKVAEDLTEEELELEIALAKEQIKKIEEGKFWFLFVWAAASYPNIGERLKCLESIKAEREQNSKNHSKIIRGD